MKPRDNTDLPFKDKVVWITGASEGIGEQLSYDLDRLGASLILSARREDKLQAVNDNLPSNPGKAFVLPLDLENLEQLPEKASIAVSHFGRIDYLVHNAALAIRDYAMSTGLAIDQKIMKINYFGSVVLTKQVLPQMLQRGSGHIVVLSSLSGKYGVPRTSSYAASKHALHGFYETLRSEIHDSGVLITIIVPGIIRTNITEHALMGDGKTSGRAETSFKEGYPLEKCAAQAIKAIRKGKEEVFIGGTEGLTLWINRVSPWLLRRILRNHPLKAIRKLKARFSLRKIQPA